LGIFKWIIIGNALKGWNV